MVDNNVILPGNGVQRFICPTGNGALVTERAFVTVAGNGPGSSVVQVFFQTRTGGLKNTTSTTLKFKDGISEILTAEIPSGTTQLNVVYSFPNGGVVCIETLARQ